MQTPRHPHSIAVPVPECPEEALSAQRAAPQAGFPFAEPRLWQTQHHVINVQDCVNPTWPEVHLCSWGDSGLAPGALHCLPCGSVLPGELPGGCSGLFLCLPVVRLEGQPYSEEVLMRFAPETTD